MFTNVDPDSVELGRILTIIPYQVLELKGLCVMSNTDGNTIVKVFSKYRQNLDSIEADTFETKYINEKQFKSLSPPLLNS